MLLIATTHNKAPNRLMGGGFLHEITDASGEYFTYSVHVESKLKFNLIGNLEQPWKITGLFCFCFCFIHKCIKISRTSAEQSSGRQVVLNYRCEGHLAVISFMQVSFLVVNPYIFVAFLF